MIKQKDFRLLLLILFCAFILRFLNISFPALTTDEARIAYRGYTLSFWGQDELGRVLPVIFNSLEDYQLPTTSYLTALGIFIFGKSDFGARIPFIFLGTALVYLIYQNSKIFTEDKRIWLISAFVVAFSPPLIFLSKVPNESMVMVFLTSLLFFLLTRKKLRWIIFITVLLLTFLTSKQVWLIMPLFTFITLFFYQETLSLRKKLLICGIVFLTAFISFTIFLNIPQGRRSLVENNLSLFTDITISNGISRLRGQGLESGWPNVAEKILFNKLIYIPIGTSQWLSNISPNVYFGQFDGSGRFNFGNIGAFSKSLVIPIFLGLVFLIRQGSAKQRRMLLYLLVLTFPSILIYPKLNQQLTVLTLPFLAVIISLGLVSLKKRFFQALLILMVLEVLVTVFYKGPQIKQNNFSRPGWITPIVLQAAQISVGEKVILSDDITDDTIPFILWYTNLNPPDWYYSMDFPYKFKQGKLGNIVLHGNDSNRNICTAKDREELIISRRDLKLIEDEFDRKNIQTYKDSMGEERAYQLSSKLCLNE